MSVTSLILDHAHKVCCKAPREQWGAGIILNGQTSKMMPALPESFLSCQASFLWQTIGSHKAARLQGFWWTHGHCFISVPSWRAPISSRCFKEIFHPHDLRASPTHCGKTSHWNAACNSSVTLLWMLRPPAFLVARLVTPTSPTNPGKLASSLERIRMGVSVNTHYTNFLHFAKLCWQQYRRCHTTKNISKTNCQFHEHDQTD